MAQRVRSAGAPRFVQLAPFGRPFGGRQELQPLPRVRKSFAGALPLLGDLPSRNAATQAEVPPALSQGGHLDVTHSGR